MMAARAVVLPVSFLVLCTQVQRALSVDQCSDDLYCEDGYFCCGNGLCCSIGIIIGAVFGIIAIIALCYRIYAIRKARAQLAAALAGYSSDRAPLRPGQRASYGTDQPKM